jgi:hypothetical protein
LSALNLKSALLAFPLAEGTVNHRTALTFMEPARCEVGMCEKCVELDAKIDRYKQMARMITDQRTLDGIAKIIEEASAEKAALHSEREP